MHLHSLLRAEPLDVININLNLIPFNSENSGQNSLKRRTTVKKIKRWINNHGLYTFIGR